MDLLKIFDNQIALCDNLRISASMILKQAEAAECKLLQSYNVDFHDRGPGFAGWYCKDFPGYFETVRDAVKAKIIFNQTSKK